MRVYKPTETPYERQKRDNEAADGARAKAITDYNIMMGNLEDPAEEEEEDE